MTMHFDPSREHAVWDGRFQPFHRGHLAVIQTILELHDGPFVVMIIQSSIADHDDPYSAQVDFHHQPHRNPYSAQVDFHHQPHRNPLTLWERYCLVRLALDEAGIDRPDRWSAT